MTKRIIAILIALMLALGSAAFSAYASNPLDELDDQGETESMAGITWDQINEMAQNSPNSLSPVQGLVLWMFAIIAFLKLAQKMDDLLMKLGLNVTQTGGRALGDLMVAGMAIKNIGGMVSKGMGRFGFGGGSGGSSGAASGSGAAAGTGSAGSGPAPIPSGSSGATGGNVGTMPTAGRTSTGPTSTVSNSGGDPMPAGGGPGNWHMPTGGNHSDATRQGTSPSGAAAPPYSAQSGVPASEPHTGAGSADGTYPNKETSAMDAASPRSPIGKAADWMNSDGFAQGAIKAGAKGGLIGVGAYTIKTGGSKIGAAASSGFGGSSTPSVPYGQPPDGNNAAISKKVPPNGFGSGAGNQAQGGYNAVNPEAFHLSGPSGGMVVESSIPSSVNGGEYRNAQPSDSSGGSGILHPSHNNEDWSDSGPDAQPIPASIDGKQSFQPSQSGTWQEAVPSGSISTTAQPPNNESWHDSLPIALQSESPDSQPDYTATEQQGISADSGMYALDTPNPVSEPSSNRSVWQNDSAEGDGGFAGYEHTPVLAHGQPISEPPPQSDIPAGFTHNDHASGVPAASSAAHAGLSQPMQIQPDNINNNVASTIAVQPTQAGPATETIRSEPSAVVQQVQNAAPTTASQTAAPAQTAAVQTTINDTAPNRLQPSVQGSTQARPTAKAQPKNESVKGSKRGR